MATDGDNGQGRRKGNRARKGESTYIDAGARMRPPTENSSDDERKQYDDDARLIRQFIESQAPPGILKTTAEPEDLLTALWGAIAEARRNYDPDKGMRWIPFAWRRMEWATQDFKRAEHRRNGRIGLNCYANHDEAEPEPDDDDLADRDLQNFQARSIARKREKIQDYGWVARQDARVFDPGDDNRKLHGSSTGYTTDHGNEAVEKYELAESALAKLTTDEAAAVESVIIDGMTTREAGQALGVSRSTASERNKRAVGKLTNGEIKALQTRCLRRPWRASAIDPDITEIQLEVFRRWADGEPDHEIATSKRMALSNVRSLIRQAADAHRRLVPPKVHPDMWGNRDFSAIHPDKTASFRLIVYRRAEISIYRPVDALGIIAEIYRRTGRARYWPVMADAPMPTPTSNPVAADDELHRLARGSRSWAVFWTGDEGVSRGYIAAVCGVSPAEVDGVADSISMHPNVLSNAGGNRNGSNRTLNRGRAVEAAERATTQGGLHPEFARHRAGSAHRQPARV